MISGTNNENILTYTALVVAMICWGLSFIWYKQALENIPPITLVLSRLVISLPFVVMAALLLKRLNRIKKTDLPVFLLLALLEPFIYFIGESTGIQYISASVASILIATIPIFTLLVALVVFKEKLSNTNYLGFAVSFLGVAAVVLSERGIMEATLKGIAYMMLAIGSGTAYGFLIKKIGAKYSPLTIVITQNLIGSIYFIPVYFWLDHDTVLSISWNLEMFKPVINLAIFSTSVAYLGYIHGVRKLGVSKATIFANFIPVFTAIFAYFIINEPFNPIKVVGVLLVVGGLILSQVAGKRRPSTEKQVVNELY